MSSVVDLYKMLGLPSNASDQQILAAYRQLADRYHPDKHPNDAGVAQRFKNLEKAYSVLADPKKRAQYDAQLKQARSATASAQLATASVSQSGASVSQAADMAPAHEASLKVSAHDRVSSIIVAMLYMLGFLVLLLFLLWLTTRPSRATTQIAVEYIDELPGGEQKLGEGRDFEEPGREDIQDLATPDAEQLLAAVTDVASTSQAASDMSGAVSQGAGGGDRRRAGAGGNASVPRWERWEVRFTSTSLTEYAAQLDSFNIELAAAGGGRDEVDYATQVKQPKPNTRSAAGGDENRLYMSYRRGQLKQFDRQLLKKAGISTDGRMLLQFYPPSVEGTLAALEQQRAGGRPLKEIRKTVFAVRKQRGGYRFEVIDQQYR